MYDFDEELVYRGKVVYWKDDKGYGFLRSELPNLPDIYIHFSEIEPDRKGFKKLLEGDDVEFNIFEFKRDNGETQLRARWLRILR